MFSFPFFFVIYTIFQLLETRIWWVSLLADDGLTGGLFIFVRHFTIFVHCLFHLALVRTFRPFLLVKCCLSVLPKMPNLPRPKCFRRVLYAESSASSTAGNPQVPSTSVVPPLSFGFVPNRRLLFRPLAIPVSFVRRPEAKLVPQCLRRLAVPALSGRRLEKVVGCLCMFRRVVVPARSSSNRLCGRPARSAQRSGRLQLPRCLSPRPRRRPEGCKAQAVCQRSSPSGRRLWWPAVHRLLAPGRHWFRLQVRRARRSLMTSKHRILLRLIIWPLF